MFFRKKETNLENVTLTRTEYEAIEHLTAENFAHAEREPTLEELNDYRLFLVNLSEGVLHRQYLHNLAGKMFASPQYYIDHTLCNADILDMDYYCKMPKWNAKQTTNISFEKDPEYEEPLTGFRVHDNVAPYIKNNNKRLQLIQEAVKYGELEEYFTPMAFVLWARKKDIGLPEKLVRLVTKYASSNDVDWEARCKELEAENAALQQEIEENKPPKGEEHLHVRIEESYQQLIAAFALWKCPNLQSINGNYLASQFAGLDLPFDMRGVETINKRLEPVKMLLGINQHNHNKKKENHKK